MGEFSAKKETYTSTENYNPEILKICKKEKLLKEINILRNNDKNMPVINIQIQLFALKACI